MRLREYSVKLAPERAISPSAGAHVGATCFLPKPVWRDSWHSNCIFRSEKKNFSPNRLTLPMPIGACVFLRRNRAHPCTSRLTKSAPPQGKKILTNATIYTCSTLRRVLALINLTSSVCGMAVAVTAPAEHNISCKRSKAKVEEHIGWIRRSYGNKSPIGSETTYKSTQKGSGPLC